MRVQESIGIPRSPADVWEFVVDPMNDPRWCRKVTWVERSGPRQWTVVHKPVPLRPAARVLQRALARGVRRDVRGQLRMLKDILGRS